MKPKVLVTRKIYERPLQLLREKAEVTLNPEDRSMTPEEIMASLPGKMGVLAMGGDPWTAKLLEAGKDLKRILLNAIPFSKGRNSMGLQKATTQTMHSGLSFFRGRCLKHALRSICSLT